MSALSDATEFHNALNVVVAGYGRRLDAMARENEALNQALNSSNARLAAQLRITEGLTEAIAKAKEAAERKNAEILELKRELVSFKADLADEP